MRFQRLDLNLLVALDALLSERSVSLAADRLCLSQSATSSALGRLREYFGDELMVVRGRNMVLTARAEQLIEPVREALNHIRTTIAVPLEFVPEQCERTIRVMASDYVTEVLLTSALLEIKQIAPKMQFEIMPMNDVPAETLDRGQIDLLVTIDMGLSADHPSQILFEDDYVVIGWQANPALHAPLTRQDYFVLGHVSPRFGMSRLPAFEDSFLRRMKQTRRVEVVAPTFLSVPGLLIGTDRVSTVQRKLAARFCLNPAIIQQELPFVVPPIRETVQWHLTNNNDAALRWVVEMLALTAAEAGTAEDGNVVHLKPAGSPAKLVSGKSTSRLDR